MRNTTVRTKLAFGVLTAAIFTTMAVGAGSAASAAEYPSGGYDNYRYSTSYGPWVKRHSQRPVSTTVQQAAPVKTAPVNTAPATPAPAAPANTVTATGPTATGGNNAPVQAVLLQINKVRAAAGAKALTLNNQLVSAAHQHNLTMAGGCGLSHQCAGEGNGGARISAQGLKWSAWAENIGYGTTSAATDAAHTAVATKITQSMIDEVAPNDGHRRNILNPSLSQIGIDLYRDSNGTLWMTQDFAN
ncbi:CAP domain-containing protein [Cryptosporangium phraense]|uniref:CAP domain-containing protein n=1 Tax=Cryptosporangium phraense TaxID=2593070 RepID=UPI00147823FE|nr:CAP domain-containing protein [Cryptosporangium phraense]